MYSIKIDNREDVVSLDTLLKFLNHLQKIGALDENTLRMVENLIQYHNPITISTHYHVSIRISEAV